MLILWCRFSRSYFCAYFRIWQQKVKYRISPALSLNFTLSIHLCGIVDFSMACTLFAANRCSCLPVTTTSILEYERVKYNRWNDVMGMLSSDMEVWTFLFVHHHQCCYFLGALVKDRLQIAMSTKVFWSSLKQLLANKQMTWNLIRVCTSFTLFHLYFMKNTSSLKPAAINSIIIALTH